MSLTIIANINGSRVRSPLSELLDVDFRDSRSSLDDQRRSWRSLDKHCANADCDDLVRFRSTNDKCITCYNRERSPYATTYDPVRVDLKRPRKPRKPAGPGNRKLTPDAVHSIRRMAKDGVKPEDIASEFNVAHQTIWDVIHKRTWKSLKEEDAEL